MASPFVVLGVSLMDRDHAHMEMLLQRVAGADGAALPELLMEIEAETRAHFSREEELMQSAGVPVLQCHIAQHANFLFEFDRARRAAALDDMPGLRHFLCSELPDLYRAHVDTVDRVTSGFLRGQPGT